MIGVYKVTATSIGETKRGYKIYKLQINNSFWATKLVPLRKLDRKYNKLYQLYIENNKSLEFLVGKYISISLDKNKYGFEFSSISSFDVFQDFKEELDASKGKAFSTNLPIYDFLSNIQRKIESDGSIKIISDYGDMRVFKINEVNVCYKFNISNEYLNLNNIEDIFEEFYKGVALPAYSESEGGAKSYYKIDMKEVGIVKMDNHVKISYKMTTSGDYDRWLSRVMQKIGDELPKEQVQFLKESIDNEIVKEEKRDRCRDDDEDYESTPSYSREDDWDSGSGADIYSIAPNGLDSGGWK